MFQPVQFGKYYLKERIAVGGMAEIFRASLFGVDGFEKSMVVKQILPQFARNPEFIKMFVEEAKIAVSLTHGNIVPVYELGCEEGIYFIAMEYVHGKNLADIIEQSAAVRMPMSVEHALYLVIEICKGLSYAHRRTDAAGLPLGLVHRDINPANIMVSWEGEVKITDFGIAKGHFTPSSTRAGVVRGPCAYMSPHQATGGALDYRTDIFSLGIILHELLTGQDLFTGAAELETMEKVCTAPIPLPSASNTAVSTDLDAIVLKALARRVDERFADANELQLALSRVLYRAGAPASASSLTAYLKQLFPMSQRTSEQVPPVATGMLRQTPSTMAEPIAQVPSGTMSSPITPTGRDSVDLSFSPGFGPGDSNPADEASAAFRPYRMKSRSVALWSAAAVIVIGSVAFALFRKGGSEPVDQPAAVKLIAPAPPPPKPVATKQPPIVPRAAPDPVPAPPPQVNKPVRPAVPATKHRSKTDSVRAAVSKAPVTKKTMRKRRSPKKAQSLKTPNWAK